MWSESDIEEMETNHATALGAAEYEKSRDADKAWAVYDAEIKRMMVDDSEREKASAGACNPGKTTPH